MSLTCASCGAAASEEFRFCPSCGVALASAPVGAPEPVASAESREAATARAWSQPLSGVRRPPLAERRLVSVLFLDLVGFTSLSEMLDAEDVRDIQSRYFELARATVAHYGGSLEKFIGDAVMAVWGTPVAHEDDGERAVRAALEIVAGVPSIPVPGNAALMARGAVTTGEAAVTLDAEGEGMVTGDLVNTASRLQNAAEPGTVLADGTTREVVGEAAVFEAAGEMVLKGKASPVAAWRAAAISPRVSSESRIGHRGPFVGRDSDLHALRELLRSVIEESRLQVVSLIGIAGIGKSRLAWEVERAAAEMSPRPAWYAGRAPGYGEGIAFEPVAEMVRRSAGIADADAAEVARRALEARLAALVSDAAERSWMGPRLLALLGSGAVEKAQREELFAAWRRFFEAEAERGPIVLVFEDLQWADAGLLDFIEYLAEWSRRHPILVMTLGRPELLDLRPTWGAGLPHFTAMHLDRLPDPAIGSLLAALAPGLDAGVAERIRERADGVPLYAVEMARMLTERGGRAPAAIRRVAEDGTAQGAIEIPESLHALIAARIDALPAPERSLLLSAAVLGRRFRPEALAALAGDAWASLGERLRNLVRREFLSMDDEPRSPGRGQLSFVQELVREVAYNTLSRRQRREQHLAAVSYLESIAEPDLVEPIAEHLLAAHAATPGDQPEAVQIADRARLALRRAAARAQALHAPHRALAHLEHAIGLADAPAEKAELSESAGLAARAAARYETAEEHLRHAIELRESLDDRAATARHRAQLASLLLQAQRSDTALAELEDAWADLAAGGEGAIVNLELPAELARAHLLRGHTGRAVEWAERAIRAAGEHRETPEALAVGIDARLTLGTARAVEGQIAAAAGHLQGAIADAEKAGLGTIELRGLNNLAWVMVTDDPRATAATARRGLELAERLGNRDWGRQLLDIAAIVSIETGEWAWALELLHAASRDDLPTTYRLDYAATQAILHGFLGDPDAARHLRDLPSPEPDLDREALGWVDAASAHLAFLTGDLATAVGLARTAAEKSMGYERAVALALGVRVAAWSGDRDAARSALEDVEAEAGSGRASGAGLRTARAAVAALTSLPKADREWRAALRGWRDLDLPVRLALCHLDRWRLAGSEEDRQEAIAIFGRLGAKGLLALAGEPEALPERSSGRARRPARSTGAR